MRDWPWEFCWSMSGCSDVAIRLSIQPHVAAICRRMHAFWQSTRVYLHNASSLIYSISQSIDHLLAIITRDKNTENHRISTNGRYNQAETALTVDLDTKINQLQSCSSGSLTTAVKTEYCSERWNMGSELESRRLDVVGWHTVHAFMTLSAKKFDLTEILLWCLKSLQWWPCTCTTRT